jgi:peptide/nickel transport system substrate-binding protein
LNPYKYDPSKAATLLGSVGFHMSNRQWIMPNGKPLDIALSMNSSWSDQIVAHGVLATGLKSFGISASESLVEGTTLSADLHSGNFQIAAYCCNESSPNPIEDFVTSPMGSSENFTASGINKDDPGIGYGPVENVPGIGMVNIPNALNEEYSATGPGPEMNKLVWDWARFVDQQVPFLEYAAFNYQIVYSSRNYT